MTSRSELVSDLLILDVTSVATFGSIAVVIIAGLLMMSLSSGDQGEDVAQQRPDPEQPDTAPAKVAMEEAQPEPPRFAA